jgi:hypothetical protein
MWPTAYPLVLGTVQLPPYRALLLLGLLVVAVRLGQGALRLRAADYLIVLVSIGIAATLIVHHGLFTTFTADTTREGITSVGYQAAIAAIIETAGAYLLARSVITTPAQFAGFMKALGWGVLIICAFTVVEARTGVNAFGIYQGAGIGELRFGLHRAAGPFPHSIAWGVFAATPFAFFAGRFLWKRRVGSAAFAIGSMIGVVTSVSSTAALAIAIQGASLAWARFMRVKRRWAILALGGLVAFLAIEAISSRPAIRVIVSRLSFSAETGYMRLTQWDYGWREVMAHPFLGIGMREWARPEWVSASIDSFWLALSIRHGLIVPALLLLALVLLLRQASVAYKRGAAGDVRLLIRIWCITVMSLVVAGLAVHYWAQSLALFFFLLGCLGALTKAQGRSWAPS